MSYVLTKNELLLDSLSIVTSMEFALTTAYGNIHGVDPTNAAANTPPCKFQACPNPPNRHTLPFLLFTICRAYFTV